MKKFKWQYKIIQVDTHEFKAYYRGWFRWHCFRDYNWVSGHSKDKIYYSWKDAENAAARALLLNKHAWEKKNFPKVERLYPPNKLPGE